MAEQLLHERDAIITRIGNLVPDCVPVDDDEVCAVLCCATHALSCAVTRCCDAVPHLAENAAERMILCVPLHLHMCYIATILAHLNRPTMWW